MVVSRTWHVSTCVDVRGLHVLYPSPGKKISLFSSSSVHHPLSHVQGNVCWGPALAIQRTWRNGKRFICRRHKTPLCHRGVTVRRTSHLCLGMAPHWDRSSRTLLALLWAAGLCCRCRPAATQQLLNDRSYQVQDKIHCPNAKCHAGD